MRDPWTSPIFYIKIQFTTGLFNGREKGGGGGGLPQTATSYSLLFLCHPVMTQKSSLHAKSKALDEFASKLTIIFVIRQYEIEEFPHRVLSNYLRKRAS